MALRYYPELQTKDVLRLLKILNTTLRDNHGKKTQRYYLIQDRIVEESQGLIKWIVLKFSYYNHAYDDVLQVAYIGLIKSIENFKLEFNTLFASYAIPTIVGEIRKYYRNQTQVMHVSRRIYEMHIIVNKAITELLQVKRKMPNVSDIIEYTGLSKDDVLEGLWYKNTDKIYSLDSPTADGSMSTNIPSNYVSFSDDFHVYESIRHIVQEFSERDKKIFNLYFIKNLSQTKVAAQVKISQMHVSRIVRAQVKLIKHILNLKN